MGKSKPAGKSPRKKETQARARAKGKPSRRLVWALGGGAALLLAVVVGVVIAGLLGPRAPEVALEAQALPV